MKASVRALICVIVCASSTYAGVVRDDRSDSLYQSLGASPSYASVGQFLGSTSASGFAASGTLIAPNWVLTAAHVVDQATSLTFNIGGSSYTASQWAYHSNWTGDLAAGYDIALVKLSTSPAGITPALRYTGSDELGRIGTSVGYGKTGTGLTGAITFDGLKRAGENVIDRFYSGGNKRIFLSDFDNPTNLSDSFSGSSIPLNLEYLIAPGDSGGGVFADFGSGPQLTGVHSFGMARDGVINFDYGDISGHTRVSLFNSWIDTMIGSGGGGGGGGGKGGKGRRFTGNEFGFDAVWAVAVPEPTALYLILLGTCGLVFSRLRPLRR
jgi:Trypsin